MQEISALLSGLSAELGVSEEELEDELAALVSEQLPDVQEQTSDVQLPDVPQGMEKPFFFFFFFF